MSLNVDFKAKMGEVILNQTSDGKTNTFVIDICQANATCAFIYTHKDLYGETEHTLLGFFADKQHINNLIKNKCEFPYGDIQKVTLNMWYKDSKDILQYFVRMGHKVECYYKEPTDKTKRV
jgi:hypothetical protein